MSNTLKVTLTPEIEALISNERLQTYVDLSGNNNREDAFLLYRLNGVLSGAFFFPLQSLEVALRNALNPQLASCFRNKDWLINLPSNTQVFHWSQNQLEKIQKSKDKLAARAVEETQNRLVSDLDFGFWIDFLESRNKRFWPNICAAFPKIPGDKVKMRGLIYERLNRLRRFRNRIAHHEIIINHRLTPNYIHRQIIEAVGWMSPDKSAWTYRYSKAPAVWTLIEQEKKRRGWSGFTN